MSKDTHTHPVIPVILSGGAGTRLWPLSRQSHPKPFMPVGARDESLLQQAYCHAAQLAPDAPIFTVTNRDYYFKSIDEIKKLDHPDLEKFKFLLEPNGRNTGAAIALAALAVRAEQGDDAVMLVLPADHLIEDTAALHADVACAAALAAQGHLVVFGIRPDSPATGYGYVEYDQAMPMAGSGEQHAFAVTAFKEKPSLAQATDFLEKGHYLWNAGLFCFTAGSILLALEKLAPEIYQQACRCWDASHTSAQQANKINFDAQHFNNIPATSIDYAVMEKAENVVVVPAHFSWQDIGCWQAVSRLTSQDDAGNASQGDVLFVDAKNNYVRSKNKMVAAVGVEDLIIVNTDDALLVSHRDQSQQVKQVVEALKAKNHPSHQIGNTAYRPWGEYTVLEQGCHFKIKRIVVKPGGRLSLQKHQHRSEHWVVIAGQAEVIKGKETFVMGPEESTFIPAGSQHRLSNVGQHDLIVIEVQTGSYLGEDDIVRFDDIYSRNVELDPV